MIVRHTSSTQRSSVSDTISACWTGGRVMYRSSSLIRTPLEIPTTYNPNWGQETTGRHGDMGTFLQGDDHEENSGARMVPGPSIHGLPVA